MINNDLDITSIKHALGLKRRLQIQNFLQPGSAEQISACLENEVPWSLAEKGFPDKLAETDIRHEAHALSVQEAQARAMGMFHFCYERYLIIDAIKADRERGLLIHHVLQFFNSPEYLEFIRYLTGDTTLNMVSAQATRYRPGQFLRMHNDRHDDEGRKFAYVLNLSKAWQADWGGLLHFTDENQNVTDSFVPHWNSLSLFAVPVNHYVSMVLPWAEADRYAITGWWHSKA